MRRVLPWAGWVVAVGIAAAWMVRDDGYPDEIHISKPSDNPGKFAERYQLRVVSANEDGHAVNVGTDNPDAPSGQVWRVQISGGGAQPKILFCVEKSR